MMVVAGRFAQHEIVLADELVVVQHVQLLAGAELLATDAAREAVEVEDFVARFPHQIRRCDAVAASAAFRAVSPARVGRDRRGTKVSRQSSSVAELIVGSVGHLPKEIVSTVEFRLATEALVGQRLQALAAAYAVRVPRAFEDVEQELVENRLVAAGTGVSHPADRRLAAA